jgi:hypothetical protein
LQAYSAENDMLPKTSCCMLIRQHWQLIPNH